LPGILFGGLAIGGSLLILLLPETLNRPLPQTIEDVENWSKKDKKKSDEDIENWSEKDKNKSETLQNGSSVVQYNDFVGGNAAPADSIVY